MYPTLVENDYLIINRMAYKIGEPKDGDIIVFKTNLLQDDGKERKDGANVKYGENHAKLAKELGLGVGEVNLVIDLFEVM